MMAKSGKKVISADRVVTTSFLVDVSDVAINFTVAYLSGSVVMLAEGLQGAADMIASGFLLIGLRSSKLPADRLFPFGHSRAIYFWSLLSAVVTFTLAAGFSFYFGLRRFLQPEAVDSIGLAYVVLAIAMSTNGYSFWQSWRRISANNGGNILAYIFHSPLVETKNTLARDLMGTVAAVIGFISLVIYQLTGDFRLDGIGAMMVGSVIAALALMLIYNIKDFVIGRSASPELEEAVRKLTSTTDGVEAVLDLRTMQMGPGKVLVNMEVHLKHNLSTKQIEKLIDKIRMRVMKKIPSVSFIQIEPETPTEKS